MIIQYNRLGGPISGFDIPLDQALTLRIGAVAAVAEAGLVEWDKRQHGGRACRAARAPALACMRAVRACTAQGRV